MKYNDYDTTLKNIDKELYEEFKFKSENFINTFDWVFLEEIKNIKIENLTEYHLQFMGFEKMCFLEIDYSKNIYRFPNFTGGTTFYEKRNNKFYKLGYKLMDMLCIENTSDLINESILKDKLHIIE